MMINLPGVSINSTPRADGRYQGYIIQGKIKKYVYGRSKHDVLTKIKQILKYGIKKKPVKRKEESSVPTTFHSFTQYYFENFRKLKVSPKTMEADIWRYNRYLKDRFGETPLKKISPKECQELINLTSSQGKGKTTDELFSLMNVIFKMAIKHGLISRNPMDVCLHIPHETIHGKVLTYDEVSYFKKATVGHEYQQIFMIALYTGLRPNEFQKFERKGNFLIAINSKRKNGKVEYKSIPIMTGLAPYLKDEIIIPPYESIRKRFKEILPDHTLKDLRKTFNSRCVECGINDTVRKIWMGHSLGALGESYTELSNEFFLEESKKFFYPDEI